jgi:hypothetical protein
MFDCSIEIGKFHNSKVSLGKEDRDLMKTRRDANRKRLKTGLEQNNYPLHYGCHTQGSYAMKTMIKMITMITTLMMASISKKKISLALKVLICHHCK